jgi:predicted phosphoribosyltransferase
MPRSGIGSNLFSILSDEVRAMRSGFADRAAAGRSLASRLWDYSGRPGLLVLALPRGGVPVACQVARALRAELDVLVVRKLGVPGHEELAMGAIASGGARVLNQDVIEALKLRPEEIEKVAARELAELERREKTYRGDRAPPQVAGRTVILVDDGLATGASMRAAAKALRQLDPAEIIVAVPVAPAGAERQFTDVADHFVAVEQPRHFSAVGAWYQSFDQTSDAEVQSLLNEAWRQIA